MPSVLTARDGKNHTIFDERDIFLLVADCLGTDFRDWLEGWAEDYKDELQGELDEAKEISKENEKELDDLKNHQRRVFTDVYEEAERLMELSEQKQPDLSEIHSLADRIWDVLGNEL